MKYRKLGRTNLMVSSIGFGALPLTGLNQQEADKVLNLALDKKINFIDTARGYRESEELIGNSISKRKSEFYIATKTRARKRDEILKKFETSLKNLKMDNIDLYQIHYVNTTDELDYILSNNGTYRVFAELRDEKVIKFIGITGHDTSVLLKAAKTGLFDTIQGAFSYIENNENVINLINYCKNNDIGFIVQKPLAGGAITNGKAGLKWILQHPVSTVIPGMIKEKEVIENSSIADGPYTLTEEEEEQLHQIAKSLDRFFCRRCYYCHPVCPENIRIGVILEFFGKSQQKDNLPLARRWYREMEIKADACTECGLCEKECPYNLPIIELLKEAHKLLG